METEPNPRTQQIVFLSHQLKGIGDRLLLKIKPPRSSLHTLPEKRNTRELNTMRTAAKKLNLCLTESVPGQLSRFVMFGLISEAEDGRLTITEGAKLVLNQSASLNFGSEAAMSSRES